MATEFRKIGHDHFVPNVLLNGEMTRTTNNPGAATYVYPTDDVENDMGPAAKTTLASPTTTTTTTARTTRPKPTTTTTTIATTTGPTATTTAKTIATPIATKIAILATSKTAGTKKKVSPKFRMRKISQKFVFCQTCKCFYQQSYLTRLMITYK